MYVYRVLPWVQCRWCIYFFFGVTSIGWKNINIIVLLFLVPLYEQRTMCVSLETPIESNMVAHHHKLNRNSGVCTECMCTVCYTRYIFTSALSVYIYQVPPLNTWCNFGIYTKCLLLFLVLYKIYHLGPMVTRGSHVNKQLLSASPT
jgi:hypothetical protein